MPLSRLTPFVTILVPVWTVVGLLDVVLKDHIKIGVANRLFHAARLGTHPLKLAYYGFLVLTSAFYTILIITLNGGLQTLQEHHNSLLDALRSSAPLLFAVLLKITLWDYFMALKSFVVWNSCRRGSSSASGGNLFRNIFMGPGLLLVIIADLWLTSVLTGTLFNWADLVHLSSGVSATGATATLAQAIGNLVKSIDLFLKDSIQRSFYFLNGSLTFYLAIALSRAARGCAPYFDFEGTQRNIFKICGAILSLMIVIVLFIFWMVNR